MRSLLAIFALLATLTARAQPENFMIASHVFARPAAWTWVDLPTNSTVSAKMIIKDSQNNGMADVVFVETKVSGGWASADETINRWRANFLGSTNQQNLRRDERKLDNVKLTFVWQEGTYQPPSASSTAKPHFDYAQYGVIIEDGKNNVLARVLGDRAVVEQAKDPFRKMIERAVTGPE